MHAELARVDPVTAARLPPGDTQRIQRALEVFRLSGRPMSSFHREPLPASAAPPLLSLEPASRAWLHERIALRFTQMLEAGLVDEVAALRARGDLDAEMPSMRCVGYRQTWEALDRDELDELPERGIAATRQLAKRQLTWLRGMDSREVLACDEAGVIERAVDRARRHADRLLAP
jgi:tRNA dimethylallyltransferase